MWQTPQWELTLLMAFTLGADPINAADVDDDVELYGPLSLKEMKHYHDKAHFDPRCPERPLRLLPIGRPVEDTDQSRAFRKFAYEHD